MASTRKPASKTSPKQTTGTRKHGQVAATGTASGLMSAALDRLAQAVAAGVVPAAAPYMKLSLRDGNASFELEWSTETSPLADTPAKRQARIKAFWPSLVAVTNDIPDDQKGKTFRRLALYITGMESEFALNRDQLDSGPAKGIYQIQCGTLKDIIEAAHALDAQNAAQRNNRVKLLANRQSAFADETKLYDATKQLPGGAAFPANSKFSTLCRDNDDFASFVLRIQLMRSSGAVPSTPAQCFAWWKSNWHGPTNLPADAEARFLAQAAMGDADLAALGLS